MKSVFVIKLIKKHEYTEVLKVYCFWRNEKIYFCKILNLCNFFYFILIILNQIIFFIKKNKCCDYIFNLVVLNNQDGRPIFFINPYEMVERQSVQDLEDFLEN